MFWANFVEANTLEPFYFKANLGTRFEVGFDNRGFLPMVLRIIQNDAENEPGARTRRLFKGSKIVGHIIVSNSTNALQIKRK